MKIIKNWSENKYNIIKYVKDKNPKNLRKTHENP